MSQRFSDEKRKVFFYIYSKSYAKKSVIYSKIYDNLFITIKLIRFCVGGVFSGYLIFNCFLFILFLMGNDF